MRRTFSCAGLIVSLVMIGACGSSKHAASTPKSLSPPAASTTTVPVTSPPTTAAPLNSCTLVPQAAAEGVMQTKLLPAVHVTNSDDDTCTYAGDPSGPTAQFEVFVGAGAKKFYDDDNITLHHTFTDVPGIGDEAHEETDALFFRKGTTWVALHLVSLDDFSKFKVGLESLANNVAAQM
jgi:hypothetical protein